MYSTQSESALSVPVEGAGEGGASYGAPRGSTDPEESPAALPGRCILLVEDDFLVGMEMESGLEEAGYEVAGIAATAEEAVAIAARRRPDLVVMDIRLASDRDGVDAALEIYRTLGIRSLFASATIDSQIRARAAPAQPLGWVTKPYRVETLIRAVKEALGSI